MVKKCINRNTGEAFAAKIVSTSKLLPRGTIPSLSVVILRIVYSRIMFFIGQPCEANVRVKMLLIFQCRHVIVCL